MNLFEWEVSIVAVQVLISSALSIVASALLMEMTFSCKCFLCTFFKSFENQTQVYILG